jgi:hypothetical protein
MVERAAASAGLKLKAHPHMLRHACVGHYENGDTLVIDTIGISAKSFVDNYRTPHTDQLHVVERWKLAADGNTVDVSIFVEDPGAFTTPWTAVQRWRAGFIFARTAIIRYRRRRRTRTAGRAEFEPASSTCSGLNRTRPVAGSYGRSASRGRKPKSACRTSPTTSAGW